MAVQIQYRRGPASEWTGINPTLALGEPGYETDTGKIKIGTGSLAWNDLVYTAADSFLNGEGAPDASLGKVGDFYLDTTIYHLYGPKTATVGAEWGEGVYLTGNTIRTGTTAPDASIGRDGDFYIDTVANQIYGPKTDTVGDEWGSPTNLQVVSIDDLGDVDTSTAPPQAGEALVWDDSNSVWKPGPAGAEASGSVGQIQYNDGASPVPGLAASASLAWDDTAKELSVGGDINLDDGGSFSTTVQAVTPTANRTISFPDRTGTVALVNGANGTIQYNDAGTLKGNSDFTVDLDWNDAAVTFTGLKLNVTDTASASGSKLLDLQVNGSRKFYADKDGVVSAPYFIAGNGTTGVDYFLGPNLYASTRISLGSAAYLGWTSGLATIGTDLTLFRDAANILAQRNGTNAQTFRLYNTWGNNGVDFERTSITRDATGLVIDAQKGGTGADPTNLLDVKLDGTSTFKFDGANRRFYLGSNDYSYLDVSADGYTVTLKNRYNGNFTFKQDFIISNSTGGILLGSQTFAPGIRLGTFASPPTQVRILNAISPTSTTWLFGKYGGAYAASTNYHNGTGVSVWCGYGAQPTDANADGGNAGNFDVWLNAGGAGAGTGVAGANGRLRVINDDTDTEVFGVEQSGVVQIGGERLIADLPSSPTAGMITRVTDATAPAVGSPVGVGGGTAAALVWYNGAQWTVIGV